MDYGLDLFITSDSPKPLLILNVHNERVHLKTLNISWETQDENVGSGKYTISAQGYYSGTNILRQFDIDVIQKIVEVKEVD